MTLDVTVFLRKLMTFSRKKYNSVPTLLQFSFKYKTLFSIFFFVLFEQFFFQTNC